MEMNTKPRTLAQDSAPGGVYEAGLRSLVRSLQLAFAVLVILIVGMLVWFFTIKGYFAVRAQESVIVLRFGEYQGTYEEGWHWRIPYPVHQFISVRTAPQTIQVDFVMGGPEMRGPDGQIMPRPFMPGRDDYLITADANIVHASISATYHVADPYKYYRNCLTPANPMDDDELFVLNGLKEGRGPQTMIKALLSASALEVTASMVVDELLYSQSHYRDEIQRVMNQHLLDADIGVVLDNLTVSKVQPPVQTQAAFNRTTVANASKDQMINEARQYQVSLANMAEAQRAKILADAETYRQQLVAEIKAEKIAFESILKEYEKNPETVLTTLYNNALSAVLDQVEDQFVLGTATKNQELRLKLNPVAGKKNNPVPQTESEGL